MKVYVLRHGETEYNVQKRYQGTLDIPLSLKGREELIKADICPQKVYVSPLCRATETAEILFPNSKIIIENDLREMCFGAFQGKNYVDMEKDPDYLAWVGEDCTGRCPGGETKAEFSERTCAVFERLIAEAFRNNEEMLVILAHGGTQMAVMEKYAVPQKDYYSWCGANAGGYVLEVCGDEWKRYRTMKYICDVQYIKNEVQK